MLSEFTKLRAGKESFVRRHPLAAYFILAYAISWGLWFSMIALPLDLKNSPGNIINGLAIFGPTLAGLLLTAVISGGEGVQRLLGRLSPTQVSARSYGIAIFLPFLIMSLAILIGMLMGDPLPTNLAVGTWILPLLAEFVRVLFFGGPLGEEIGWRGFALPRLLDGRSAFKASLILGLIWGLWHAPIYFVPGSGQNDMLRSGGSFAMLFPAFVVWTIGLAILFTWLYKMTNRNLLIAILFHTAVNTAVFWPSLIGVQSGVASLLNAGLTWVAAIIISRTKIFREA